MKIGAFDFEKDGVFIIAELSANHNGKLQNESQEDSCTLFEPSTDILPKTKIVKKGRNHKIS